MFVLFGRRIRHRFSGESRVDRHRKRQHETRPHQDVPKDRKSELAMHVSGLIGRMDMYFGFHRFGHLLFDVDLRSPRLLPLASTSHTARSLDRLRWHGPVLFGRVGFPDRLLRGRDWWSTLQTSGFYASRLLLRPLRHVHFLHHHIRTFRRQSLFAGILSRNR